jgi:lysophospholipase L1-like esterase
MDESILIFGASTTQGFYDIKFGGWADRIKSYLLKVTLNTGKYYEVFNLGISGDTTKELLKRFENECNVRRPSIIIMSIGDNDSSYLKSKQKNMVPIHEFEDNLNLLIKKAKKFTNNIILLGCKNVIEDLTNPVSWQKDLVYKNSYLKMYDDASKRIAEESNAGYVKLFGLLDEDDFADGLHPNTQGHEKIFCLVRDFIKLN